MKMWKDVKGYEGLYMVSDSGLIRLYKGRITRGFKSHKDGRLRVRLYKNKKHETIYVHRIVAEAFIPNPNGYNVVNHLDSDPSNNAVSNLEWTTQRGNMIHASKCGRLNTDGCRVVNINTGATYKSIKQAAEALGIKPNTLVYKVRGLRQNETPIRIYKHNT